MRNKINLLHLIASVYQYGGLERKVIQLINNLDKSAFNIHLVSLANYKARDTNIINDNIALASLDKKEGVDLSIIIKLARILKKK